MTSKSCDGRREPTLTGISREMHTWAVSLVASNLPLGRVCPLRWGRLPLRGLRSTVNGQGLRRCELAGLICRPVSDRRIVDSTSQLKRAGQLFVGYRAICPHPDPVRRICTTGRGARQNRNYHLPVYEIPSKGGDLTQHQRRVMTDIKPSFPFTTIRFFTIPTK